MVLNLHLYFRLINSITEGSPLCDMNFLFLTHFLRTQFIGTPPSAARETILGPLGTFSFGVELVVNVMEL